MYIHLEYVYRDMMDFLKNLNRKQHRIACWSQPWLLKKMLKVVLEARVTHLESADIKAILSLSQNKFVYKYSVQGNLYLAR